MTLLVKRTLTGTASGVTSHSTENAKRSTPARSEQMSSVRGLGSMSMRRCTRYVVVALLTHRVDGPVPARFGYKAWLCCHTPFLRTFSWQRPFMR